MKDLSCEEMKKVAYHLSCACEVMGLSMCVKKGKSVARGKGELAKAAGVSLEKFNEWLKDEEVIAHLQLLGMSADTRIFSPRAVEYICEMYGITLD